MKASKLIKQEKLTLDFSETFPDTQPEDTTLNLTIEPSRLTPAMEKELQDGGENARLLTGFITACVVEWDLLNDDGSKVPLTEEGMKDIPILVLGLIVNGIGETIAEQTSAEGKG